MSSIQTNDGWDHVRVERQAARQLAGHVIAPAYV